MEIDGAFNFNDLVEAVKKANIYIYTNGKKSKFNNLRLDLNEFVHALYIECAKYFYQYPYYFYDKGSQIDIKRNEEEAKNKIKNCIEEGIRNMIPMKMVLNGKG